MKKIQIIAPSKIQSAPKAGHIGIYATIDHSSRTFIITDPICIEEITDKVKYQIKGETTMNNDARVNTKDFVNFEAQFAPADGSNRLILGRAAIGKTTLLKEEIRKFLKENQGKVYVIAHCAAEYEELAGKRCRLFEFGQIKDALNKVSKKKNKIKRIYIDDADTLSGTEESDLSKLLELAAKYNIEITAACQTYQRTPQRIKRNTKFFLIFPPYLSHDIDFLSSDENILISEQRFYPCSIMLVQIKKQGTHKAIISLCTNHI